MAVTESLPDYVGEFSFVCIAKEEHFRVTACEILECHFQIRNLSFEEINLIFASAGSSIEVFAGFYTFVIVGASFSGVAQTLICCIDLDLVVSNDRATVQDARTLACWNSAVALGLPAFLSGCLNRASRR